MADFNRDRWEDRNSQQNRDSRYQNDNNRDDYTSNYGNSQSSRYGGEDYRNEKPLRNDYDSKSLYPKNERRDDYSNLDSNRERSTNMGSGYDPYNYGQTIGSFNQGKEGSYSQRFDYNDHNNRSNTDNRNSGYNSDYNRSYGRGSGSSSSGNNQHRDRNQENRHGGNGNRDWWDRATDEVASWFGDDGAEKRREDDKRFGPHKGKGPKGYTRSDERIKDDVNDRLSDDSFIDASEIDVTVESCEVVLTGTVDSKEEKRRAEDIAERVSGVKNIENRLKVRNRDSRSDGAAIYKDSRA